MGKRRHYFGFSQELVSGLAFCVTSASMTLLNKAALSAFHFTAPTTLLCFQCTVTLLLVLAAFSLGYGRMPPLTRQLLLLWLPVNVLFVGMVWVSGSCLQGNLSTGPARLSLHVSGRTCIPSPSRCHQHLCQ
jgi:GDP-mannose transporter